MAQVGGRGRQVQIVCVAIVLLVAASLFDAPPSSANESTATPSAQKSSADPERGPVEPDSAEPAESPEPDDKRGGKVIYLTFDDGPSSAHTRRVLELLDQYDAKATFFQVGEEAAARPELTRAVVAQGHALGSHTWNHKDLRKLSRRAVSHQITRTSTVLRKISGRPVNCLRPPYGAKNARVMSVIRSKKLAMKLWDIDPRDWKKPGAGTIAGRVIARADPGDVTLMHDGGGNRSQSVRALKRILQVLSKRGYSFETLPGC
jgi:peptidoglycan/xylan/chitin deacetylase (PgdA/CDA1 family)